MLVMRLLAYSPTPISKSCIIDILDLIVPMATDIISRLYEDKLVKQTINRETGKTLYCISDDFLVGFIQSGCSTNEQVAYILVNSKYLDIYRGSIIKYIVSFY